MLVFELFCFLSHFYFIASDLENKSRIFSDHFFTLNFKKSSTDKVLHAKCYPVNFNTITIYLLKINPNSCEAYRRMHLTRECKQFLKF